MPRYPWFLLVLALSACGGGGGGAPVQNLAPQAALSATPTSGSLPLAVTLNAAASSDFDGSIVKFEWDFENDGSIDLDTGSTPQAAHTYGAPAGPYTARVRVTDNDGAQATATVELSVTDSGPQWHVTPVAALDGALSRFTLDAEIVDGRPAIVYATELIADQPSRLLYVRAQDASGLSWPDLGIQLDTALGLGGASLDAVSGNPAAAYSVRREPGGGLGFNPFDLGFVRANDASGSSWPAGSTVSPHGTGSTLEPSLDFTNGAPIVAFTNQPPGGFNDLMFIRGLDENGAAWGDPLVLVDHAADRDPLHPALHLGRRTNGGGFIAAPAVAFHDQRNNQLGYITALDLSGNSWPADPVTVDGIAFTSLTGMAVNTLTLTPVLLAGVDGAAQFYRSQDTGGTAWNAPALLGPADTVQEGAFSLAVANAQPVAAYLVAAGPGVDNLQPRLQFALDGLGSSWDEPLAIDNQQTAVDLVLLFANGNPALVLLEPDPGDALAATLKFAVFL